MQFITLQIWYTKYDMKPLKTADNAGSILIKQSYSAAQPGFVLGPFGSQGPCLIRPFGNLSSAKAFSSLFSLN